MTETGKRYVCEMAELDYDGRAQVTLDEDEEVLIIRHDGELLAFSALCPHQFAPLIGAEVIDGMLVCQLHGWRFALGTGADPENAFVCITKYECGADGDRIWVGAPVPRAAGMLSPAAAPPAKL